MIKVVEGYLDVNYEETAIYSTSEMKHFDMEKLTDLLDGFDGKKVRITIEALEKQTSNIVHTGGLLNAFAICPSCEKELPVMLFKKWNYSFCSYCGKSLIWE